MKKKLIYHYYLQRKFLTYKKQKKENVFNKKFLL